MFVRKIAIGALVALGIAGTGTSASAATIDTSGAWSGSVNSGWYGSGQSLTVDGTDNVLNSITFYFDAESVGRTFDLTITDSLSGGTAVFATSFVVSPATTIDVGAALTPGSIVFALIDYNGFNGRTAHYGTGVYGGGNSVFDIQDVGDDWTSFSRLDHRFTAEFGVSAVPLPAGAPFLIAGIAALAGLGAFRRRRKT